MSEANFTDAQREAGADIGTPVELFREERLNLLMLGAKMHEVLDPFFRWSLGRPYTPPQDDLQRMAFDGLIEKHRAKVEGHRAFLDRQKSKGRLSAEARKTNHGSTTVEPRLNHGSTTVEPRLNHGSTTAQPRPNLTTTTTDTDTTTTTSKNRTDADTSRARAREGKPSGRDGSASASESAQIAKVVSELPKAKRPEVWRWTDDDIRYGKDGSRIGTAAFLSCAFGKGAWKKVVEQAGEDAPLELFITFRNEIRLGESVDNPAAAFTKRCRKDLGVDFNLPLGEPDAADTGNGAA